MTKNQQLLAKMGGGSLALLLSLSLGQQASAGLLVSNLPPTTATVAGYPITFDTWLASSFTTGSASDGYTVGSVTLRLAELTASPNLYVGIWNDPGLGGEVEFPGQQRLRFTHPSFTPNTTNNYTFTATTPRTLAANTNYWLVVGITEGPGEYLWGYTVSPNQTGFTGWSIAERALVSDNQAGTWSDDNFSSPISAFQFSVATPPAPVPEPATLALLGLGAVGMVVKARRRRAAAPPLRRPASAGRTYATP
jgi:hypothetical protein